MGGGILPKNLVKTSRSVNNSEATTSTTSTSDPAPKQLKKKPHDMPVD
jgi:hypothetical protein